MYILMECESLAFASARENMIFALLSGIKWHQFCTQLKTEIFHNPDLCNNIWKGIHVNSEKLEHKKQKRTILVVDDEESIRVLFSRSFKEDDVYTCGSAEEAFQIMDGLQFDVMMIDIGLPGMDGCSFCADIRDNYPNAFILAMTGYADKYEFSACQSAGFNGYFAKPLNLKMLHQVIDEHFNNKK